MRFWKNLEWQDWQMVSIKTEKVYAFLSQGRADIITNEATTERIRVYDAKRLSPTQEDLNRIATQKVVDVQSKATEREQAAKDEKDANKERF